MYLHVITQIFQIHMLLLNRMMICISSSLKFRVKRLPNSSMSVKVNIGNCCKFLCFVKLIEKKNEVLLIGTKNNKYIDNSAPVFEQMDFDDI